MNVELQRTSLYALHFAVKFGLEYVVVSFTSLHDYPMLYIYIFELLSHHLALYYTLNDLIVPAFAAHLSSHASSLASLPPSQSAIFVSGTIPACYTKPLSEHIARHRIHNFFSFWAN